MLEKILRAGLILIHIFIIYLIDGVQKCQNTEFLKSRNVYLDAASRGRASSSRAAARHAASRG
jgi:hypothetical protein